MIILEGSQVVMFDVDDTLLLWSVPDNFEGQFVELDCWVDEDPVKLAVNTANLEQLKGHHSRGHKIVVWSAGGWEWAEKAVKILNIEKYVHLVMEKPTWSYDDKRPEEFMPKSQWVGNKEWLNRKDRQ
jgi:hypothetical protein